MGVACNSLNGSISALLFLLMYCSITLAFFAILLNVEHLVQKNNMTYLNQLYSLLLYNKEIAFHIILIILAMAAIPPFSSFFAKLFIFIVSIEAKLELITAIMLGFTLISTFYYLNFIQQLIFFKYNKPKLFFFNETIINIIFLRLNSFIFLFSFMILPQLYLIGSTFVYSCVLTLTF